MLESLFNKVAGINVCNSIKMRLQQSCFFGKFVNFLRTYFLQSLRTASAATSEVQLVFSKESRTKTGATVNNKNHIQQEKCICWHENSDAGTVGVL